ncbi:OLC1v1005334C1 [Oldenlandia corymbosa var. corymbosa]|uniref:OLC1v1005334C1 n=1 Tax=Oldenlandia corymbosa var. corymbosa TaxID=529605 RepID=A0AAV1DED9_OLDCO|nr:OLC1v1005334C1 [Oldenlandia corymbosa var. corymbosa]
MLFRSKSVIFLGGVFTFFSFFLAAVAVATTAAVKEDQNLFVNAVENGKVLDLDESNFDAAISTFDYIFVDFYAPWCGHCKRLTPELEKAAPVLAKLKPPIVVAKIDADKYRRIGSKHDIDGFPTLKIFMHGVPTEYYGQRKADILVRFLKKFVAPDVAILSSDSSIKEFIETADTQFPVFIGFGLNESTISNLAVKYKKKAWFAVAKDFSDETMAFYDFDKAPAVVSINPGYNEQSVYYGPFEESFLEDYIKQSLLPLVLPINQDSLKLLKDDERKIALTIVKDESDAKSKDLVKLLKAAASANRDLVFGYVGLQQFEALAESFEVNMNSELPKMVIWDGNEEYLSVIGSESMKEVDQGSEITRFLEGYRQGSVIQKRISGPSFMGFINSLFGMRTVYILIFVVAMFILILTINKEEPQRAGTEDSTDQGSSSTSQPETREKED